MSLDRVSTALITVPGGSNKSALLDQQEGAVLLL